MKVKVLAAAFNGVIGLALVSSPQSAQAAAINFDDMAAPCAFADTQPLTNQYSSAGITFSGFGSVLNECGNFGIDARSGDNFLAFNQSQGGTVEFTFFDNPQNIFSFYHGSGSANALVLTVFDANGVAIGQSHSNSLAGQYAFAGINMLNPFTKAHISSSASSFVYDDLSFSATASPVPEPATWAFMIIGFGAVGASMRSARRKTSLAAA